MSAVGVCLAGIAPLSLELALQLPQHGLVLWFLPGFCCYSNIFKGFLLAKK